MTLLALRLFTASVDCTADAGHLCMRSFWCVVALSLFALIVVMLRLLTCVAKAW